MRRDRVEVSLIGSDAVFRIEIKVEGRVETDSRVCLSECECIRIRNVGDQSERARVSRSCAHVANVARDVVDFNWQFSRRQRVVKLRLVVVRGAAKQMLTKI